MSEQWLTLDEASALLQISKYTLAKWRRSGKVKDSYPFGRPAPGQRGAFTVRIAKSELERLLEDGQKELSL